MNLASFFLYQHLVVVDRIEDDFAVVEWNNDRLSIIPIDEFNTPPNEGEFYHFVIQRSTSSQCRLIKNDPIVIQCNERSLVVPQKLYWRENSQLTWQLLPIQEKEKFSKN
jgi:hypothetical protein